ncbi:DUF1398 domain-containing protein [Klebsiella aerogenes]|uniref:DUF1398 family protein n=1 Tax=Klebsiella aerogenes TaxID=548 RepID=UPI001F345594|nr:DUF1398 family protein [Klebsiella aerogenes]
MSVAISVFNRAQEQAMAGQPAIGGFPYLAETLHAAGVLLNEWSLPSCQGMYITAAGPVMMQGTPLVAGIVDIPSFDEEALIHAIREDQAGRATFSEFLNAIWKAGVIRYVVDFSARQIVYQGCFGDEYEETYPAVTISQ